MAKLDEQGSKEVTFRQSTLWFIATGLVLATVLLGYGSSAVSWVRDDESQRMQIQQLQNQVNTIMIGQDKIMKLIEEDRKERADQAIKEAEKRGYELGNLDNRTGHSAEPKK